MHGTCGLGLKLEAVYCPMVQAPTLVWKDTFVLLILFFFSLDRFIPVILKMGMGASMRYGIALVNVIFGVHVSLPIKIVMCLLQGPGP
jgi:hypothetical protein